MGSTRAAPTELAMMRSLFRGKPRRGTPGRPGFADKLAYSAVVGDGIIALKDFQGTGCGPLLAGFWFEGPDLESASSDELERIRHHVNSAFRLLDAGWMVHIEAFRRVESMYLPEGSGEAVDRLIDEERARGASYYVTEYALFVTQAQGAMERERAQKLKRLLLGEAAEEVLDETLARVATFEQAVGDFEEALSVGLRSVRRMRQHRDNDELLQAIGFAVNGTWKKVRCPSRPNYLDALLARDAMWSPDEFLEYGEDALAVVGIMNFPRHSVPGLMNALSVLGLEYRWSTRFIFFDYLRARSAMRSIDGRWKQKGDDDASDRRVEIAEARKDVENGLVRYGQWTSVVVLRERIEDMSEPTSRRRARERVEQKAREVLKALQERGFEAYIERTNRMDAFLGSLPGHGVENVRKPLLNTVNVADLMPLAKEWTGSSISTCSYYPEGSPALLQARTWSGAPFFVNLHVHDVGHTVVFGPPGRGKSTLLALFCSQFQRYAHSQVFVLDYGASMMPLALAREDGAYYELGGSGRPELCPLAEIDTAEERAWACGWIAQLCEEQGVAVVSELNEVIREAVEELAESGRTPAERTLSDLVVHLQHEKLNAALAYYTKGPGGRVLNGKNDALRYARFSTFETEKLFALGDKVAGPALSYVFRQIEKRLVGFPSLLVVDEAWLALSRYPDELKKWLNTFRKKNCAVVIATQQVSAVMNSSIADVVFECCSTKILLPNDEAPSNEELYTQRLRLNAAQIETLARVEAKRWYLYLSQGYSRLFTLDLDNVAKAFVGASSQAELRAVRALHAEHGALWPAEWLRRRGLGGDAERFLELRQQDERRRS
jgi:type IV secretion/conjugal transfer VirB4 family ATPase